MFFRKEILFVRIHFQKNNSGGYKQVNGIHYSKTARAWLENLDSHRDELDPVLSEVYGEEELTKWRIRWRLFFMACEELFGYHRGREWMVSHYRFVKP